MSSYKYVTAVFYKEYSGHSATALASRHTGMVFRQSRPCSRRRSLSILIGMIVTLFLKKKDPFKSGITLVSKKVLQCAVVLLGFGLNLTVILQTGKRFLPDHRWNHLHGTVTGSDPATGVQEYRIKLQPSSA